MMRLLLATVNVVLLASASSISGTSSSQTSSSEASFQQLEKELNLLKKKVENMEECKNELTNLKVKIENLEKNDASGTIRSDYCAYQSVWEPSSPSVVTYEKLIVSNNQGASGSSLNIHTGYFHAGVSGVYRVDVSMNFVHTGKSDSEAYLYLNGARIAESRMLSEGYSSSDEDHSNSDIGGRSMMVELNAGDNLSVINDDQYKDNFYNLTFCISLI